MVKNKLNKMKLNNRGYVLMEIIMASMIAFGIVYYMLDLTIKLKNKNDDLFIQTVIETDRAIIQNRLVKAINENYSWGTAFNCNYSDGTSRFVVSGTGDKILSFNGARIDTVSKHVTIDKTNITCSKSDGIIKIVIPLKAGNNTYYARVNYIVKMA